MERAKPILRAIRRREEASYLPSVMSMRSLGKETMREYLQWRRDMALWFLYTAHDYGIPWETVEAAQAMVDRVSSIDKNITENFDLYQISCFVCLLIACKTMETKLFFKESCLWKLGRGYFSKSELNDAELKVLYALKWRIQPPTSIDMANQLLALVKDLGFLFDYAEMRQKVTQYLIVAVVDSRFLPFKKSSIALAAVLCAIRPKVDDWVFQALQNDFEEMLLFTEQIQDELMTLQLMFMGESNAMDTPGSLAPWNAPSQDHIVATGFGPSHSKQTLLLFEPAFLIQLFEIPDFLEEQERMIQIHDHQSPHML